MSDWRPHSGPLAAEQLGDRQAPRITFMHGFAQTGNSWKPIAEHFAEQGFLATVVDLPANATIRSLRR